MASQQGFSGDATALPLDRRSTTDRVTEHIRWMIFRGELRPGDKVPQDDIARALAVSRLPVREALLELDRDGLVRTKPHVGTFIAEFDDHVIEDHFEIIALIQAHAAELVVRSGDEQVLAELQKISDRMKTIEDPQALNDAAIEFQRVMNTGANSSRLRAVLRALGRLMPHGVMADALATVDGAVPQEVQAIADMLDAMRTGSPDKIRDTALRTNRRRAKVLIEALQRSGALPDS